MPAPRSRRATRWRAMSQTAPDIDALTMPARRPSTLATRATAGNRERLTERPGVGGELVADELLDLDVARKRLFDHDLEATAASDLRRRKWDDRERTPWVARRAEITLENRERVERHLLAVRGERSERCTSEPRRRAIRHRGCGGHSHDGPSSGEARAAPRKAPPPVGRANRLRRRRRPRDRRPAARAGRSRPARAQGGAAHTLVRPSAGGRTPR